MVFTALAWRMAYHHFLLLRMFEVNLTPSPRTQKSPALRKSHGSGPLWSVPGRTTPNTQPGASPTSVTSGHGHRHAATGPPGLRGPAQQTLSSSSTSLLNYTPSLGCGGQKPFWTMFMCKVDRNGWRQPMCTITSKGRRTLRQVRATHDLHYSSLMGLGLNSRTYLNAMLSYLYILLQTPCYLIPHGHC